MMDVNGNDVGRTGPYKLLISYTLLIFVCKCQVKGEFK